MDKEKRATSSANNKQKRLIERKEIRSDRQLLCDVDSCDLI